VHPLAPGVVPAEDLGDLVVVAGQVVLGQQVDDQGAASDIGQWRVVGTPLLAPHPAVEVAPLAPWDEVVGEPLLGDPEVAVELSLDDLVQLTQQVGLGQVDGRHGVAPGG